MTRIEGVILFLIIFSWIIFGISILLLPDQIPIHFGTNGVDRLGSKFELILFPIIITLIGLPLKYLGNSIKNEKYGNGKSASLLIHKVNISLLLLFEAILVSVALISI